VERLAKHQIGRDVGRHEHPPLQNVDRPRTCRLILYLGDGEVDLGAYHGLPLGTDLVLTETSSEQLPPGCMLLGLDHIEHAKGRSWWARVQVCVPGRLCETTTNAVHILERLHVGCRDLSRRQANNGTISLMHGVYVVHTRTGHDSCLEPPVGQWGIPWSRKLGERGEVSLSQSLL